MTKPSQDFSTASASPDDSSANTLIEEPEPSVARDGGRPRREMFAPSHFLAAIVLLIVVSPFLDSTQYGKLIESLLMTVVFLLAILVNGKRRHVLGAFIIAMIPIVIGMGIYGLTLRRQHPAFMAASGLFFVAFAIIKLLGRVLRARHVDAEVLSAAIATYLCLGILWSFGYTLIAQAMPDSFHFAEGSGTLATMRGFTSLYFSFCTLTTVGFGDIIPVAGAARMLVITESTCGVFYMTILIARLVSVYSRTVAE